MFLLVTGASGSGKSEYAERMVTELGGGSRFYVATMEACGEEGKRRVERHRRLRAGKDFQTVEQPRNLRALRLAGEPAGTAVLLECVMNLAANEMFSPGQNGASAARLGERAEARVLAGIESLTAQAQLLVVVTGEVGGDGGGYGAETEAYIGLMGRLNRRLARQADGVVEVVCGIPIIQKEWRG